jgi:hypothetical protein
MIPNILYIQGDKNEKMAFAIIALFFASAAFCLDVVYTDQNGQKVQVLVEGILLGAYEETQEVQEKENGVFIITMCRASILLVSWTPVGGVESRVWQ